MGQARAGPLRESTGLALARTNPMVPMVARTNPAWDQAGLAIWVTIINHYYNDQQCIGYTKENDDKYPGAVS